VSFVNGRPTFASADGRFAATLHGVMQLDAAHYDQPSAGPTSADFRRDGPALGATASSVDAAHARDLKDGDLFRRSRIGLDGTAFSDWDYRLLFDFAGTGTENAGQVYETWVQYSGLKPAHLRIGAFPASIGLDDQASTNSMPFLERAVSSDLARGLAAGDTRTAAELFANGDRWLVSGALTGRTIGAVNSGTVLAINSTPTTSAIGTAQTYGDQIGLVGRIAGVPFQGKDWLIHLGVHASYLLRPSDASGPAANGATALSAEVVSFSNTPELRVDGTKLINTGNIDARHADTVGLEFAAQKQNLLLQSEYEDLGVQRSDGVASPRFHGYYVSATWVLTGEARSRNAATAAFDGPVVAHPFSLSDGGWGAWELGLRYSDADLNYHAGAAFTAPSASAIRGGDEQTLTGGLNWYVNSLVRFMLDFQHVRINRLSPATAANSLSVWQIPTASVGAQIGQSYDVVSLRSQVAF